MIPSHTAEAFPEHFCLLPVLVKKYWALIPGHRHCMERED